MLTGIHHIALTVTDLQRSVAWYRELLGLAELMGDDGDEVSFRLLTDPSSRLVLGLRQYAAGSGDEFDERRTGMDHMALGVESAEELAEWEARLSAMGAKYTPATETPIGTVIVFRDPDGIQLEFWLPAA